MTNKIIGLFVLAAIAASSALADPVGSVRGAEGSIVQPLENVTAKARLRNLGSDHETLFQAACCKVCKKGKACGDSCINRNYTCRNGAGCACDG